MVDDYYALRGWDRESGLVRRETLVELELEDLVPPLKAQDLLK